MNTFTEPRDLVGNPNYHRDREEALSVLDPKALDAPIADLVTGFAALPHCFTLQCCHGHFIWALGQDDHNIERIPAGHSGPVTYRIAYLAICLEDSARGRELWDALSQAPRIDPGYIQFGSADWFWERWPNSYVLQVEPALHRFEDRAVLDCAEARHTERARDAFFREIGALLAREIRNARPVVV